MLNRKKLCTRIVAVGSAIAQRACDALCHIHVTLKWAVRVINKLSRRPTLLTTPRIPPPAHCRGRDHRGGWTHIFGDKASERYTSRPVEKRNFNLPRLYLAPSLRVIPTEFPRGLSQRKTRVPGLSSGVVSMILRSAVCTTPTFDTRTNRRTHDDRKYRASIGLRG